MSDLLKRRLDNLYLQYYYDHGLGERPYKYAEPWLSFFDAIADRIVTMIGPHTVLDVGCAMGILVTALRKRGVEAFGFDISEHALQNTSSQYKDFVWRGDASDPEAYHDSFDLIVCIEVVEHLLPPDAQNAIGLMSQHSDLVLFSSNPADFSESTHINSNPTAYWVREFARYGMFRARDFDAAFVSHWAVLLQKEAVQMGQLVYRYEDRLSALQRQNHEQRAAMLRLQEQLNEGR